MLDQLKILGDLGLPVLVGLIGLVTTIVLGALMVVIFPKLLWRGVQVAQALVDELKKSREEDRQSRREDRVVNENNHREIMTGLSEIRRDILEAATEEKRPVKRFNPVPKLGDAANA